MSFGRSQDRAEVYLLRLNWSDFYFKIVSFCQALRFNDNLTVKTFFLKLYLLVLVNFNLSLPHHALGIILLRFVGEISLRDVVTIGFARPSTNRGNKRYSGELRHGSSLHAWFYDLILFLPVSSFILTVDRCV